MCFKDLYYKCMRWGTRRLRERNEIDEALEPIKEKICDTKIKTLEHETAIADNKAKYIGEEVRIKNAKRKSRRQG